MHTSVLERLDSVEYNRSSGEFHTFRLPVPDLWADILQKMKAAGLNAVSLYTHMGLINPAPGFNDLSGFRALQPFFDACREAGLWVVLRPGDVSPVHTEDDSSPHFRPLHQRRDHSWRHSSLGHI
jgi:beta-galactosidase GanA